MKIIDKNTDFYDYFQNIYRDASLTFDRRDSYILDKEMMCHYLWTPCRYQPRKNRNKDRFVLLQVSCRFWLFFIEITEWDNEQEDKPIDYSAELITTWTNYNKPSKLIDLKLINFWAISSRFYANSKDWWKRREDIGYDTDSIRKNADKIAELIDIDDFEVKASIDGRRIIKGDGSEEIKHIPILKSSGLISEIDPQEMFLALEEYFLSQKTASERTESKGLTNKEKIENHGFDTKISFRGKAK